MYLLNFVYLLNFIYVLHFIALNTSSKDCLIGLTFWTLTWLWLRFGVPSVETLYIRLGHYRSYLLLYYSEWIRESTGCDWVPVCMLIGRLYNVICYTAFHRTLLFQDCNYLLLSWYFKRHHVKKSWMSVCITLPCDLGRVCVPMDPERIAEFKPFSVPTIR